MRSEINQNLFASNNNFDGFFFTPHCYIFMKICFTILKDYYFIMKWTLGGVKIRFVQ